MRQKIGHTAVSAIKASLVTLSTWQMESEKTTKTVQILVNSRLKDWYKSKRNPLRAGIIFLRREMVIPRFRL